MLLSLLGAGCLSHTTKVEPPSTALLNASLDDLLGKIRELAEIQSMKATVDLQLTYLNDERTRQKELSETRGFILARRPGHIRVQAQVPVTGQRALDMTSDGSTFRVFLPWQQRFYEGDNNLAKRSEKRTENIRPQHILQPLLVDPVGPNETPVLDQVTEGFRHYYVVLLLVPRDGEQGLRISRKLWFDRTTLMLSRMEIWNADNQVATLARYRIWTEQAGVPSFAQEVVVSRPLDGYDLAIRFVKPGINEPVPDDSFVLEPPKGVDVQVVGEDDPPPTT
ncbi:MAG: hypothetical protein GC160_26730 [Acidobacteria bacterium]|nr:hypothetical protein [Acidobacteriota bacterium]